MKTARIFANMAFLTMTFGCTFNFEITSQRTALENQVMGVYQDLDDEVLLLSTMRSPPNGNASSKKIAGEMLEHRRNQQFNRDDIEEMKDRGWIGERVDGHLGIIAKNLVSSKHPKEMALLQALINEENHDREAIWAHILTRISDASSYGIKQVGRAYGDMQRSKLSVGQWYEDENGVWRKKAQEG
jgi:uncharacterized protein YdbL (DUF1318 family)